MRISKLAWSRSRYSFYEKVDWLDIVLSIILGLTTSISRDTIVVEECNLPSGFIDEIASKLKALCNEDTLNPEAEETGLSKIFLKNGVTVKEKLRNPPFFIRIQVFISENLAVSE